MAQQIHVSESIFCIGRKNWPYPTTASESYSWEGGRLADKMRVRFEILNFSTGETIRAFILFVITAMLLQY